jgi:hypothetical protein
MLRPVAWRRWRLRLSRGVYAAPVLSREEALDLDDDGVCVVDPRDVPYPGNPNEAKVRVRRDERLTLLWRSERVVLGPDENRRRRQRSPALAKDQLASVPKAAPIGDAGNQAEHALDVSSCVRDVDVEEQFVDSLGMLDHELAPELPVAVARRIREHVPAEPRPDERESERKHQEGRPSRDPERRTDERKARHAAGTVEREDDGPERAHRVGDHVDGRQLDRVQDVAQERPSVLEQIDAAVVMLVSRGEFELILASLAVAAGLDSRVAPFAAL